MKTGFDRKSDFEKSVTVNKVDLDSETMPRSYSYDGETSVTSRSNIT